MELFSKIVSWVFLPLFMPLYALALVLYVPSHQDFLSFNADCMYALSSFNKLFVLVEYFLFGTVLPGLFFLIMRRYNIITTVEMDNRKERFIPMAMMLFSCILLYTRMMYQIGDKNAPKFIISLALSGVIVSCCFILLNFWKKVSIHAAGTGIMVGFLLAYVVNQTEFQMWVIGLAFIISGVVMTARLYLRKHTMTEVVSGWVVGTFVTFAVNYLS